CSGSPSAPSRNGGDDRHLVAVLEGGLPALEEADVLLIDVDVDEATQVARVVDQPLLEPRVALLEVVDEVGDRRALSLHLGRALRHRAQRRGNPYQQRHHPCPSRTACDFKSASARSNAESDGRICTWVSSRA